MRASRFHVCYRRRSSHRCSWPCSRLELLVDFRDQRRSTCRVDAGSEAKPFIIRASPSFAGSFSVQERVGNFSVQERVTGVMFQLPSQPLFVPSPWDVISGCGRKLEFALDPAQLQKVFERGFTCMVPLTLKHPQAVASRCALSPWHVSLLGLRPFAGSTPRNRKVPDSFCG